MRALVIALLLAGAGPAAADVLVFDPAPLADCVAEAGGEDCIGRAAQACMEASEGGYATVVMNGCLDAELAWWDGELNARYGALMAQARESDARMAQEVGDKPSDAEALRDLQRAWIAYRDATCNYEALQWWGGTGASTAYLGCRMQLTGAQALRLGVYREAR